MSILFFSEPIPSVIVYSIMFQQLNFPKYGDQLGDQDQLDMIMGDEFIRNYTISLLILAHCNWFEFNPENEDFISCFRLLVLRL